MVFGRLAHVEDDRDAGPEHGRCEGPYRPVAVDGVAAFTQLGKRARQLRLDDPVDQVDIQCDILVLLVQMFRFILLGQIDEHARLVEKRIKRTSDFVRTSGVALPHCQAPLDRVWSDAEAALLRLRFRLIRRLEVRDGGDITRNAPETRAQLIQVLDVGHAESPS